MFMSGIIGLDLQASTFDIESQYILLFNSKNACYHYLNPQLQKNDSFISLASEHDYFSGMDERAQKAHQTHLLNSCKRILFLNTIFSKKPPNMQSAINDLTCMTLPQQSTLYISTPESYCDISQPNSLLSCFEKTSIWAKKNQLCIRYIIYGHRVNSILKPKLVGLNRYISGLASLQQFDDNSYDYHIAFWCNHHGVNANKNYVITLNDKMYFTVIKNEYLPLQTHIQYADEERIYVATTALNENVTMHDSVIIIDTNQALFKLMDVTQIQASTVVLGYDQTSDLNALALDCYLLRRSKGSAIKIIIRETSPCLRYIDEKLLLNAGVNLIIPYNVSFSRSVSLVEAIQGQIFTRNIPNSASSLLKINQDFDQIGYLPNRDFKQYSLKLMNIVEQKHLRFALVKLTLLSTMKAIKCLKLCHIHRQGDIVTACDHAIYVLFSAIRLNDVHSTLDQLFDIPIKSLFLSYTIIDNATDLEAELAVIIKRAEIIEITKTSNKTSTNVSNKKMHVHTFSVNKPLRINK